MVKTKMIEKMMTLTIHATYTFHLFNSIGMITVKSNIFSFLSSIVSFGSLLYKVYRLRALMRTAPTVERTLTPAKRTEVFLPLSSFSGLVGMTISHPGLMRPR